MFRDIIRSGAPEPHSDDPTVKVVGFHVEGGSSPIPMGHGTMTGAVAAAAGSPTPVIIPATFWGIESESGQPRDETASAPADATGANFIAQLNNPPASTNILLSPSGLPTVSSSVPSMSTHSAVPPVADRTEAAVVAPAPAVILSPVQEAALHPTTPPPTPPPGSCPASHVQTIAASTPEALQKVVGFHVEGGFSSPMLMVLGSTREIASAGSPTPVIIPLTLQANLMRSETCDSPTQDSASATTLLGQATPPSASPSQAVHQTAPADEATSKPDTASATLAPPPAPAAKEAQPPAPVPAPAAGTKPTASAGAKPQPAGPAGDAPGKKNMKEMTKAERRAIQEAQRAAKGQAKGGAATPAGGEAKIKAVSAPSAPKPAPTADRRSSCGGHPESTPPLASSSAAPAAVSAQVSAAPSGAKKKLLKAVPLNPMGMFSHLQQYQRVTAQSMLNRSDASSMHAAVLQLGLRYADGSISGANARCLAMLHTLCQVILDYHTPEGKSMSRDLTIRLNNIISFLVECRPLSVSMGNAIKFLKMRISQIDPSTPEESAKEELINDVAEFISGRITRAGEHLVDIAVNKVDTGDVILTYAYSHIVAEVLLKAAALGRQFRVIVMDSRPELEGRQMMARLLQAGIPCCYSHINALSYMIREVTKVFLGAGAVMSNGTVVGRTGSAAVAMIAAVSNKPVLVCCESYKFHERVPLDSITHNELGDPEALASVAGSPSPSLVAWKDTEHLGLLNLKYDTMPAEYVTMIVTEFGMIPPTSVPVILREYRQET